MRTQTIDALTAVREVRDGDTVLVGGFGMAGMPVELIDALIEHGAGDLTIVSNNAGNGDTGLAALIGAGRVRKIVCSFPRQVDSWHFDREYRARLTAFMQTQLRALWVDVPVVGHELDEASEAADAPAQTKIEIEIVAEGTAGDAPAQDEPAEDE